MTTLASGFVEFLKSVKRLVIGLPSIVSLYVYDFVDYVRHSPTIAGLKHRESLLSAISVNAHNIEKGLSLPKPRPGFGERNLRPLLQNTDLYLARFGTDDTLARVQGVLRAYVQFNERVGFPGYPLKGEIDRILSLPSDNQRGGTKLLNRSELGSIIAGVGEDFFTSRSSVRNFDSRAVDLAKVTAAVRVAQKAPSVCNRQSGFVFALTKRSDIDRALALQGGATGFADQVPLLLVITSRTRNFFGPERNQRWVDGGLFAMSLILGLHREGLATCCLNWSKFGKVDRQFKEELGIGKDHSIIFLLAVGEYPNEVIVAKSEKRDLKDMIEIR